MKFIDQTEIYVNAGKGGSGLCSFKTARNKPKLGPDGGNGGNGGDVFLEVDRNLNTLAHIRFREGFHAEDGGRGGSNNKTGRSGKNFTLKVPAGTLVTFMDEDEKQVDCLLESGSFLLVAKGGKRGYGNLNYVLPTRRAPRQSTAGQPGEVKTLRLQLKLLADCGLCGLPNAGKSSLLSRMSRALPKVADYPFTTKHPYLGVVGLGDSWDGKSFVLADIPGLIEGASKGRGLGHQFLAHLERTKVIVFVLAPWYDPAQGEEMSDFLKVFEQLKHELLAYSDLFKQKKFIIALNKKDLLSSEEIDQALKHLKTKNLDLLSLSTVTGEGLEDLKYLIYKNLKDLPKSG